MRLLRSLIGLAVSLGLCFGAGFLGSVFTTPSIPTWYAGLAKPSWTPPAWIFSPAWSILYGMMALALWLIWRRGGGATATVPIVLFMVQLVLNVLWSILFFGFRMPGVAFAEIVFLWLAILATMITFWRLHSWAGLLLLPYLIWTAFAGVLNFALWRMNAGSMG